MGLISELLSKYSVPTLESTSTSKAKARMQHKKNELDERRKNLNKRAHPLESRKRSKIARDRYRSNRVKIKSGLKQFYKSLQGQRSAKRRGMFNSLIKED